MASKLTKPVTREVPVGDGFVNVTLSETGVTLQGKGTSRKLFLEYTKIAEASQTDGVPTKFAANPVGWLTESSSKKKEAE